MARKKYTKIPKGSWLDQQGQRWVKVAFDVMSGGGNFLRQISVTLPVNFEISMGEYVTDMGDYHGFRDKIIQQYPSLARYHDLRFLPTFQRVAQ